MKKIVSVFVPMLLLACSTVYGQFFHFIVHPPYSSEEEAYAKQVQESFCPSLSYSPTGLDSIAPFPLCNQWQGDTLISLREELEALVSLQKDSDKARELQARLELVPHLFIRMSYKQWNKKYEKLRSAYEKEKLNTLKTVFEASIAMKQFALADSIIHTMELHLRCQGLIQVNQKSSLKRYKKQFVSMREELNFLQFASDPNIGYKELERKVLYFLETEPDTNLIRYLLITYGFRPDWMFLMHGDTSGLSATVSGDERLKDRIDTDRFGNVVRKQNKMALKDVYFERIVNFYVSLITIRMKELEMQNIKITDNTQKLNNPNDERLIKGWKNLRHFFTMKNDNKKYDHVLKCVKDYLEKVGLTNIQ